MVIHLFSKTIFYFKLTHTVESMGRIITTCTPKVFVFADVIGLDKTNYHISFVRYLTNANECLIEFAFREAQLDSHRSKDQLALPMHSQFVHGTTTAVHI